MRCSILEYKQTIRNLLHKITVMRYEDQCSGEILKHTLKCLFSDDIHMVRRLIEHEHIRASL